MKSGYTIARAVLLALVLFSVGCASTEKRFEKAGELEAKGQWLEAANSYAEVLERESGYPGASERLAEVGARAVTMLFDDARALDNAGNPEAGVDRLDQLTALVDRARGVGVRLTVPSGLERMRARLVDRAIEVLRDEGRAAVDRNDFDRAIAAYDRILSNYFPREDVLRDVVYERAAALVEWARADMARGRFRAAYERAGSAVAALDSTNSSEEMEARGVWAASLAQGVRKLAILPFSQTDSWRRTAVPRLLDDMNQSLADDRDMPPSPFIALLDPADGRRYVRINRLEDVILDRVRMADAGRQLNADFVVTGEGVQFTRTERVRREETIRTRFRGRGGADTTYVRRDLEVKFSAKVEYRVVDVASGRVRAEHSVATDITDRFTRSTFGRNFEDLDLSDRERRQFDPAEWSRQDDELGLHLADRLSAELAERIYADVLEQIE